MREALSGCNSGPWVPEDILRQGSRPMCACWTGFLESSTLRVNVASTEFTIGIAGMGLLCDNEIGFVLFAGDGLVAPLAN